MRYFAEGGRVGGYVVEALNIRNELDLIVRVCQLVMEGYRSMCKYTLGTV